MLQRQLPGTHRRRSNRRAWVARRVLHSAAPIPGTGHVFISVMNLTSNPQRIRGNTLLGTVISVYLVYKVVPQHVDGPKPKTEVDKDHIDFVT